MNALLNAGTSESESKMRIGDRNGFRRLLDMENVRKLVDAQTKSLTVEMSALVEAEPSSVSVVG